LNGAVVGFGFAEVFLSVFEGFLEVGTGFGDIVGAFPVKAKNDGWGRRS
jgi:hypothetical protein